MGISIDGGRFRLTRRQSQMRHMEMAVMSLTRAATQPLLCNFFCDPLLELSRLLLIGK